MEDVKGTVNDLMLALGELYFENKLLKADRAHLLQMLQTRQQSEKSTNKDEGFPVEN